MGTVQTLKTLKTERSRCTTVCDCSKVHHFILKLCFRTICLVYMWYPIAGPSPIAVHGPISGTKDRYKAVDRYRARSYRTKRLELRFAVAVHSPIAVHRPITVQPEFFKFPRRNMPLGICLSTDFSASSSFRRETCESTSLSALIFVPFQKEERQGLARDSLV